MIKSLANKNRSCNIHQTGTWHYTSTYSTGVMTEERERYKRDVRWCPDKDKFLSHSVETLGVQ